MEVDCKHCKHFRVDRDGDELCLREQQPPETFGDSTPGNYVAFAEDCRRIALLCGPAGAWFEPTTTN